MTPNVKADMSKWEPDFNVPEWALSRAADITQAIVPQSGSANTGNMLYAMPAGLKTRLTLDIAHALAEPTDDMATVPMDDLVDAVEALEGFGMDDDRPALLNRLRALCPEVL